MDNSLKACKKAYHPKTDDTPVIYDYHVHGACRSTETWKRIA